MTTLDRKDAIVALALAGLALLSWLPRLKGPIDLRWDGGAYFVLGTALAEGKGYRLLNEPGDIQTTLHPPMLPAIVAVYQLALGNNDFLTVGRWLRFSYLLLFVVYAATVYVFLRTFLPVEYACPASLACLFQMHTVFLSDLCFPEIPFGLVTIFFVLSSMNENCVQRRWLSVTFATFAFAVRTAGVALLAAWTASSLLQLRFKQAAWRLLAGLILVLGWAGYVTYVESGEEYKNPAYAYQRADYMYMNVSYPRNVAYKDSFSPELGYASLREKGWRFLENLALIPVSLGEAVSVRRRMWDLLVGEVNRRAGFRLLPPWTASLILLFLAVLIAAGTGLLLAQRHYFVPVYIFLFLALVCATPWPGQFNRYLTPLAPFLALSLFLAIQAVPQLLGRLLPASHKLLRHAAGAMVVLSILTAQSATLFLAYTKWHRKAVFFKDGQRVEYRLFFYRDIDRATNAGLDWLQARAMSRDVVAASDPQWAYLRTRLKTVLPPFETDTGNAQRLLDSVPVKFLIVDTSVYKKYTAPVVATHPELWRKVFSEPVVEEDEALGVFEIYERSGP